MCSDQRFEFVILGDQSWDVEDDNVDVEIVLQSGARFSATFFTLRNLSSLFAKNRITGECAAGLYLWASNMVIVESLDRDTIGRAIQGLIDDSELESACLRLV